VKPRKVTRSAFQDCFREFAEAGKGEKPEKKGLTMIREKKSRNLPALRVVTGEDGVEQRGKGKKKKGTGYAKDPPEKAVKKTGSRNPSRLVNFAEKRRGRSRERSKEKVAKER